MITLITSPPPALTPPELSALSSSTPESFVGIPPVLRWTGQAEVKVMPGWKGGESGESAGEEYQGGVGTVWITEESLSFLTAPAATATASTPSPTPRGLSIPYPHITLHALSRTGQSMDSGDRPCIYCQVEENAEGDQEGDGDGDDWEGGESWEILIVPSQSGELDSVFQTLSSCASLHPPPSSLVSGNPASGSSHPGLDMDSLVYADADGNLVGGTDGRGNIAGWTVGGEDPNEDAVEAEAEAGQEGQGGRVRSDFVGLQGTRKAPY